MALLWIESFDHLSDAALRSKYDPAEHGFIMMQPPARTGTNAVYVVTGQTIVTKPLPVTSTTAVIGFAFYMPAGNLGGLMSVPYIASIHEGSIRHMSLGIDYNPGYGSSFKFTVLRGSTVLFTSALFESNTWWYLELKVVLHATTGSYAFRVDTISLTTGSGATTNGGTGVWDRFSFYGPLTGSVGVCMDDVYVLDGSGSTRNTFLGIQRVESLLMKADSAGVGTHHTWTPSSGTDHGAMVNENNPDDTTYNSASATGLPLKETYQHVAMTLAGPINGVQVNPYWTKSDAGACTARTLTLSSATLDSGATQSPLTTYSVMPQVVEKNPNGSVDWTVATVNAAEFGVERLT